MKKMIHKQILNIKRGLVILIIQIKEHLLKITVKEIQL